MLPDFPKSRKELSEQLMLRLHLQVQTKSPVAALVGSVTQHEGRIFSYEQITDEGRKLVADQGFEEMSTPVVTRFEDVPGLVGNVLLEKIDAIADDIAKQTSQMFYRKLDEVTRAAGTAFDAGGKPLTQELFLESEESREIEFDPQTGKPEGVYIAHPKMAEAMHRLWQEWELDEAFMKRVRDLRAKKYENWRDRESRRKLVD